MTRCPYCLEQPCQCEAIDLAIEARLERDHYDDPTADWPDDREEDR